MSDCTTQRSEFEQLDAKLKASMIAQADAENAKDQADASATAAALELDAANQAVDTDAANANAGYDKWLNCIRGTGVSQLPSRA